MNFSKILILLVLGFCIAHVASAADFFEQGQCSAVAKDGRKIDFTLYSDYDPCTAKSKFNSLIDIAVTYPGSSPANMVSHYFVTGKHTPGGGSGNTGHYTGVSGKEVLVDLKVSDRGDAPDTVKLKGVDGEDEAETLTLKCTMPQICYGKCKK